ncbi:carbon-nitrogen hydrolase, partial [Aureobasidium pullulans]
MPDKSTVRVAVTQHEPEWLDLQKSVEKTCKIIEEAAVGGAELVTFAEAFIPGYPAWIWTRPLDPVLSTQYIQNSLAVDSDEMRKIQDCAARNKIVVSLGFSENDNNSVYIAQALIDSDGAMLMNRRKLKATHMERTIFGDASGDSLLNVSKTSIGRKVGTLACWEHAQPLLKFNTISQKEEIHCAAWPPIVPHQGGPDLWSLSKEGESQVIGYCVPMAADRIYRLPESIPGLRNRIRLTFNLRYFCLASLAPSIRRTSIPSARDAASNLLEYLDKVGLMHIGKGRQNPLHVDYVFLGACLGFIQD